jgi:phenylacetate-CoA ligase
MVAAEMLVTGWWGVRIGDRTAGLWGADRDLGDLPFKERLALRAQRVRGLNAFRFDEAQLVAFAESLRRWRPVYLLGYAGALDLFARFLLERGLDGIRPRAVRSSAEILHPDARERIAQAFGAPVYDYYGCREANCLAAECPSHQGLHVLEYGRLVEVLDANGEPSPAGVAGRVVVTDLWNEGMPLLRYATGDLAVRAEGPCACGRGFARLARVVGRESDFVRTPDGRTLHGEVFSHLFYHVPGVLRFQVVQRTLDTIDVLVEPAPAAAPADLGPIAEGIARLVGPSVRSRVRLVAEIPLGPNGKRKFVISEVADPHSRGRG